MARFPLRKAEQVCLMRAMELADAIFTPMLIPNKLLRRLIRISIGKDVDGALARLTKCKAIYRLDGGRDPSWKFHDDNIPKHPDRLEGELPVDMEEGWVETWADAWMERCAPKAAAQKKKRVERRWLLLADHLRVEDAFGGPLPNGLSAVVTVSLRSFATVRSEFRRNGFMRVEHVGSQQSRTCFWSTTDLAREFLDKEGIVSTLTREEIDAIIAPFVSRAEAAK